MNEESKKENIKQILEEITEQKEINCELAGIIAQKVGLEALEVARIAKEELGYKIPG